MEAAINRMSMLWGTTPVLCPRSHNTDQMVELAETILEKRGYVQERQVLGIVAGTRTKSGSTNFLRLHYVGDRDPALAASKVAAKAAPRRAEKHERAVHEKAPVSAEVTLGDQPAPVAVTASKTRPRSSAVAASKPRHKLRQRIGR
jgi:hypothetical protein